MRIYDFSLALEKGLLNGHELSLAIGVFDGVHLGHQEVFSRLVSFARSHEGVESCVITFGTNPKVKGLMSLDSLRLRSQYVASFGVDYMVVIDFSSDFSKMSGREFIRLLCTMCRVKAVIVGEDFKCGSPSDQITAKELSDAFHDEGCEVEVDVIPPVMDSDHVRISSTHIRQLVSAGDIARANRLAGSPYRYDLVSCRFERLGSCLVTQAVGTQRLPGDGIYAARLLLLDGSSIKGRLEIRHDCLSFRPEADVDVARADSIEIFPIGEMESI